MCPAAHCTPCHTSDGVLSANSGRKYLKNAAKTKVLKSFARLECSPCGNIFTARTKTLKPTVLLSYRLCATIRWPLAQARANLVVQGCSLRLTHSMAVLAMFS